MVTDKENEVNMEILAVDEYNDDGHLIYSQNFVGAFVRGKTREEGLVKFPLEIKGYCRWAGLNNTDNEFTVIIVQEKQSQLKISDADSDVIFNSEIPPLNFDEYRKLRTLALKSAQDFERLYRSISDKNLPLAPKRKTFYGDVPTTAFEMYQHTKSVNSYYFGEIGVKAENVPDIYACRLAAFEKLESTPDYLDNKVLIGSYDEKWSLRKVCRRFIWHDRIHAKAMYRLAAQIFVNIENPYYFER